MAFARVGSKPKLSASLPAPAANGKPLAVIVTDGTVDNKAKSGKTFKKR